MSTVVSKKTDTASHWLEDFQKTAGNRLGISNAEVLAKQEKAINQFSEIGIPDKKLEDFKYTNIRLYLNDEFSVQGAETRLRPSDVRHLFFPGQVSLVVVNGRYLKELSSLATLPPEVTVKNLFSAFKEAKQITGAEFNADIESKKNPMAMLNAALTRDGLFINVPKGFACKVPIHIVNISSGDVKALYNPRNIIKLGEGASLTVIESYQSMDLFEKAFTNTVTEISVKKGAILDNYILQDEDAPAHQNNIHQVNVEGEGKYNNVTVTVNGAMVRNDLNVAINGENCEIHMHGLFIAKEGHHIDNHTLVEHNMPNCFSNELYKGIIGDGGAGVFNGKIYVHQDAQKTNAYQSNKNILLGDKATINTKPQLEIYADDVKCSHGTTTGMIDEDALFYLQTRGLSEDKARKLLLQAFTGQVSDTINDDAFRHYVEEVIHGHIA